MRSPSTDSAFDAQIPSPRTPAAKAAAAAAAAAATAVTDERPWQREAKWAVSTLIGIMYIGMIPSGVNTTLPTTAQYFLISSSCLLCKSLLIS